MAVVVMDPAVWGHMDRVCEQLADHVGDEVHNDVLQSCPIDELGSGPSTRRGGLHMIETIHKTGMGTKSNQIWVGTDHWHFVEYGTKPHLITPNGPWPLLDRIRGKYFGFVVHHPGATENPFMRKAIHQKRRLPYVGGM
ncbi:MAG TPA: hypothetical protein VJW23_01025 [Propionibacteriaceae bacterium]|nr:hypothetical protein [Propionibacteriaceae bacterium]